MATAQEKQDIQELKKDVGSLKTSMAVMQTDMGYVKNTSEKMEKFIEDNKSGITLASLLNSRIISVVLGGVVGAGLYFASKIGASL